MSTADDARSSTPSSSSKRLSYVPYQRKPHQRNGSSASQDVASAMATETARKRLSTDLVASTSQAATEAPPQIASTPARSSSTAEAHQRPSPTPSTRTPSSFRRPGITSPLAREVGLVRPHRDLDAPPPPLRVASKLGARPTQPAVSQGHNDDGSSSKLQAQGLSPSTAHPHIGAAQQSSIQREEPPSVKVGDARSATNAGVANQAHRRLSSTSSIQVSDRNGSSSTRPANGAAPISASTSSSKPGSSRSSSAVATPHGSRSSTPIIGASGSSIPSHVNSYAALLAAQSRLGPIPVPQGVALAQAAGATAASASSPGGLTEASGRRTAYRSGFQPKGVVRVRTADFAELRRKGRGEGEMEEQRMDRRLAKLIAIHFAPLGGTEKSGLSPSKKSLGSSLIELDLDELKRDPGSVIRKGGSDLWSSFRARGRGEDPAIRQAEQSIVNWQDDAEVKACPICSTAFSFTVRKHHCRLCGRVVCASPHLTRLAWAEQMGASTGKILTAEERASLEAKCSGNVIADPITGRIEDVKEGAPAPSKAAPVAAQSKGVRICRDCKTIVRKRQYMMDDEPLPVFLKLYEALMRVQKEIEQSLPEFQEMVLGLQKQDQTAALGSSIRANIELQRDAVQARKQLLANFATYDELAKRIRALPVGDPSNPGAAASSAGGDAAQERIQQAIFTRANLFLQQNMLPLQSLPKPGSKKTNQSDAGSDSTGSTPGSPQPASPRLAPRRSQHANKASVSSLASFRSLFGGGSGPGALRAGAQAELDGQLQDDDGSAGDEALANADPAELREQLKVLLEQEQLVADYVESAAKARKFEDAKTLKKSHDELCREILRIQRRLVVAGHGR